MINKKIADKIHPKIKGLKVWIKTPELHKAILIGSISFVGKRSLDDIVEGYIKNIIRGVKYD